MNQHGVWGSEYVKEKVHVANNSHKIAQSYIVKIHEWHKVRKDMTNKCKVLEVKRLFPPFKYRRHSGGWTHVHPYPGHFCCKIKLFKSNFCSRQFDIRQIIKRNSVSKTDTSCVCLVQGLRVQRLILGFSEYLCQAETPQALHEA